MFLSSTTYYAVSHSFPRGVHNRLRCHASCLLLDSCSILWIILVTLLWLRNLGFLAHNGSVRIYFGCEFIYPIRTFRCTPLSFFPHHISCVYVTWNVTKDRCINVRVLYDRPCNIVWVRVYCAICLSCIIFSCFIDKLQNMPQCLDDFCDGYIAYSHFMLLFCRCH